MPSRKRLPAALRTAKEREVLMSKNNSPVRIVSYCPKPNKNDLLVSTAHSEPDLCEEPSSL